MIQKLVQISIIPLLFILTSCSVSNRITGYQTAPSDSSFIAEKINISDYEKKYSKYDGVYLLAKNVLEHSGSNSPYSAGEWKYHKVTKFKYIVLNPDAEKLTTFEYTLHPKTKINNIYLISMSPSGEIKKYGVSDLFVEKDTYGYLTYKFSFPGIKKGSIIEEGIDLTTNAYDATPPVDYEIELQYQLPCEKLEFDFAYPDWWKINTKKINASAKVSYTTLHNEEENKSIISYRADNIPAIIQEPFSPFFFEIAKYIKMQVTNLDVGFKYASPKSWEEYAFQFGRYAMNNEGIFSTSVRSKTNEITENCKTSLEKLQEIVSYVQQNIEISKDYKARDFPDIIDDEQGNPYEICGLTQAMLSKAGIQTDYLLIHSAEDGFFDETYICSDQLQIPGIKADIESKSYVVFPYYKNLPIDHIPEYIQNQPGLIVSNDRLRNGRLWNLPPGNMADNSFKEIYNLDLNNEGIISVKEEKIVDGSFGYDIRFYLSKLKKEEIKKYLEDLLTYTEGNVQLDTFEIENKDDYKLPLILKLEYSINNLITSTPEETIFQTGGLLSPSSLIKVKIDEDERVNPIKINYNQTLEKQISINFSPGWTVSTKFADLELKNDFGFTKGEYKISEGNISIHRTLKLNQCLRPKEKIKELMDIMGSSSTFNFPAIIFNKGEIPAPLN